MENSTTKEYVADIIDNQTENYKIHCPNCGESDRIREKSGLFVSLYTCEACGKEFREAEVIDKHFK